MSNQFCTNCGVPTEPRTAFCTHCGVAHAVPPAPLEPAGRVPAVETTIRPVKVPRPPEVGPAEDGPAEVGPPPLPEFTPAVPVAEVPMPVLPAPKRDRGHRLLVIGLVAALFLAGGITGALVLVSHKSASAGPGRQVRMNQAALGFDNGLDLLSAPAKQWTVTSDAILPGSTFGSLVAYSELTVVDPLVLGTMAVVTVSDSTRTVVAGIDTTDGRIAWRDPADGGDWCVPIPSQQQAACYLTKGTLELIDAGTGHRAAAVSDAGDPLALTYAGNAVYTLATDYTHHRIVVTKRNSGDLSPVWSRTYPWTGDSSDGESAQVVGGRLELSFTDAPWLIDTATGALLSTRADVTGSASGYSVTSSSDGSRTLVTDVGGHTILDEPGNSWGDVVNGTLGIGESLYSLTSGTPLWTNPDLAGSYPTWTADHRQLTVEGDTGLTAYDPATGAELWHNPDVGGFDQETGQAFVTTSNDSATVTALDRRTGAEAWSRTLTSDNQADDPASATRVTDAAVVYAQAHLLQGLTDFRPLKSAPADGGGTRYVTACGSPPTFTPVAAEDANGGVTVTVRVHAVCPSGQWLNSTGETISLTDSGDGTTYASGSFDFSTSPYWVPGSDADPRTMTLVFPYGSTFSTVEELQQAITAKVVLVPCEKEPGAVDGSVPSDPSYGTGDSTPAVATGAAPAGTDPQQAALAALKRLAAQDAPSVGADLEGNWVPQLSSKKPGTVDDGIVYSYTDILAEHLRLRDRYPGVRLLWSGDWHNFEFGDYWVTVVGLPTPGWRPALQWCPDHGFNTGHCYAERILRDGPNTGTTKHIPDLSR